MWNFSLDDLAKAAADASEQLQTVTASTGNAGVGLFSLDEYQKSTGFLDNDPDKKDDGTKDSVSKSSGDKALAKVEKGKASLSSVDVDILIHTKESKSMPDSSLKDSGDAPNSDMMKN